MALSVRRSILEHFIVCILFAIPLFAQRPVHVPPPPVMHSPVYASPAYHPPAYAPLSAPRISAPFHAPWHGMITVRPFPHPVRPFPPIYPFVAFPAYSAPFWPYSFCWWSTCNEFWTADLLYNGLPPDQWNPANYVLAPASQPPVYVYGEERSDTPQLFLKDGSTVYVTDYWLVDDQLHFTMIEQDGARPAEEVIPFDELNLQKTVDANTQRGFRFVLRNEPLEQYMRDHRDAPPALAPQ